MSEFTLVVQQVVRLISTIISLPANVGSIGALVYLGYKNQLESLEWYVVFGLISLTVSFPAWLMSYKLPDLALARLAKWHDRGLITDGTWHQYQEMLAAAFANSITGSQNLGANANPLAGGHVPKPVQEQINDAQSRRPMNKPKGTASTRGRGK